MSDPRLLGTLSLLVHQLEHIAAELKRFNDREAAKDAHVAVLVSNPQAGYFTVRCRCDQAATYVTEAEATAAATTHSATGAPLPTPL